MTLESTCRRIGEMIADNSNHYNEDELYDMIPDAQDTLDWYRQQVLMRGEGVETHLVHAGHELAVNQPDLGDSDDTVSGIEWAADPTQRDLRSN